MKNIEIKVKIDDFKRFESVLKKQKAKKVRILNQRDVYFCVKNGRLKLREINNKEYILVFYKRPDTSESKTSDYDLLGLDKESAQKTIKFLSAAVGVKIEVKKVRALWIYKHTRVHLDNVFGLGKFLELETVVKDINFNEAKQEHKEVISLLNLDECKKIKKSYGDLLLKVKK